MPGWPGWLRERTWWRGRPGRRSRGGPSRTSQAVALARAGFDRPHTPAGDPQAQQRLCRGMRPASTGGRGPALAARTRFFDEQVLAAIAAGVRQVVIAGAGYDDRALRFATPGVRFFELDHPVTQADKARRLRAIRSAAAAPVLAPADFRRDDAAAVLGGCGHDPGQPTLFVCEGLLVYLDQATCARLLAGLRARAAGGSVLAASLSIHRDGLDSARVLQVANARRQAGQTEPWQTILPAAAHLDLVRRAGWAPAPSAAASGSGNLFICASAAA